MDRISSRHESGERYPLLRIAGAAFTGLGVILLLVGAALLVFGVSALLAGQGVTPPGPRLSLPQESVAAALLPARGLSGGLALWFGLVALFTGLQLVVNGALVRLAIHLEENTRATAQCLERLNTRLAPPTPPDDPQFVS